MGHKDEPAARGVTKYEMNASAFTIEDSWYFFRFPLQNYERTE